MTLLYSRSPSAAIDSTAQRSYSSLLIKYYHLTQKSQKQQCIVISQSSLKHQHIFNDPINHCLCTASFPKTKLHDFGSLNFLIGPQQNFIKMQKMDEAESILYEVRHSAISNQFIEVQHYKQTQQNNRKGNQFYEALCSEIQNNYRLIIQLPVKGSLLLQINNHLQKWQIRKFKSFLEKLLQIFNLVSEFQIDGLSKLRSSKDMDDNNENVYYHLINKVQKFQSEQQKLIELRKQYQILLSLLHSKQEEIKNKLKKPEHYFNIKYISAQLQTIQEKLNKKQQLQTQMSEIIQTVSKNSLQFQKDLMFYRQRLVMSKYQCIQKISRLTKNSKQSLVQIFTYLYQYIENQKTNFTINKLQPDPLPTANRKIERSKLTQLIVSHTNNYNIVMDEYIRILNGLIIYFTDIGKELKDVKSKQMQLIENMNKYYQNGQCEIVQLKLVLNLFSSFLKQFSELGDKLVFSLNNFLQLKNKINKSSEMTLTLTKCSQRKVSPPHSRRQFVYEYKQQQSTDQYIKLLNQEMSEIYIQNILLKIYNDFRDVTIKIRDQFLVSQPNKRKKIDNSMSISYVTQINLPIQKRPAKKQLWLWKNWKVSIQNDFQSSQSITQIKKQFLELTSQYKEQHKETQRYNCLLANKKLKGILKLTSKCLIYQSNNNSIVLFLPFNQIQSLDIQLTMISKTLNVQTNVGFLYFSQDSDGDIKKFFINTQKAIDCFTEQNNQHQQVLKKIILSQEQIAFINKRKLQIQPDLQKLSQYQHFNTLKLQDIDIVDFYRVVYSGQPVIVHGKEYPNFVSSLMKKYKNFNETFTPYDKPVPFYYSKIEGTSFFNCSLFSERIIEYDHYLPKVPIFPETCHNKQTVRVYWVSNQQFHVRQTNNSSKAPFTQNFIVMMLITIKQVEKDLDVKFHIKVIELRDFTFKKLVLQKANQQAKWGCEILIQQIKKVMAKYKKKQHKSQKVEEHNQIPDKSFDSNRTEIRQYKTTIQNLQSKNKILIYVLVFVLISNIILKVYF